MAKVFLSFLGTNDYLPCTYHREGFEVKNVRFVQEATLRFCCKDWTSEDRVLIFTTRDAYEKNWLNDGHKHHKTGERLSHAGLGRCLSKIKLSCPVTQIDIPDGKSEEEIWGIFNIVFELLNRGDEVVFDITHAFRSIPMLAIVILNYAKVIKDVTLKGIYYGAFEVLGARHEAEKLPIEERRAPIHDLTAFDQLLDWSVAIDRFLEAGDAGLINTLARGGLRQILTETKGKNRNAVGIRDIGQTLAYYCQAMATCRTADISTIAVKLKSQIKQCENAGLLPPFQPLFSLLQEKIKFFKGDELSDGIASAKWCLEHNLIQQSATILREVVITSLITFMKSDVKNFREREIAGKAFNISFNRLRGKDSQDSRKPQDDDSEKIEDYLLICEKSPNLVEIWGPLAKLRNDLNHAGYVNDAMPSSSFAKQLPKLIHSVETELGHLNTR